MLIKIVFIVVYFLFNASVFADTFTSNKTSSYFNSVKTNPKELAHFLWAMPKGGDLHNHLSGASYAEHLVHYAQHDQLCIAPSTYTVSTDAACESENWLNHAIETPSFYHNLIDSWSMRHSPKELESGHDHFFATFNKFSVISKTHRGEALAEVAQRAGRENESYLELMLRPDGSASANLGKEVGWDPHFEKMYQKILAHPNFNPLLATISNTLNDYEKKMHELLACNTKHSKSGCQVKVRYLYETLREQAPEMLFAQLVAGFETANRDPRIVGLNLVQAEDGPISLRDYRLQMQIIGYLHRRYPNTPISLHAGELGEPFVTKEELKFHIDDAVNTGTANRIGHGVDILQEENHEQLLNQMAQHAILVEINLSSNALILNIEGKNHPLAAYLAHGVPIAFSTDDEGVNRSNLTKEFQRAVATYHLNYFTLKTAVRNSLAYSFLPGQALWLDRHYQRIASACKQDVLGSKTPSTSCQAFLNSNEKANLQWDLEQRFNKFEGQL